MERDNSGGGKEEPGPWLVVVTDGRGGSNRQTYTFQKNEGAWGNAGWDLREEGGIKVN